MGERWGKRRSWYNTLFRWDTLLFRSSMRLPRSGQIHTRRESFISNIRSQLMCSSTMVNLKLASKPQSQQALWTLVTLTTLNADCSLIIIAIYKVYLHTKCAVHSSFAFGVITVTQFFQNFGKESKYRHFLLTKSLWQRCRFKTLSIAFKTAYWKTLQNRLGFETGLIQR